MLCEGIALAGDSFDPSTAFILGRKAYDIGVRVVKWDEPQGYDGYKRPLRVRQRPHGIEGIKQLLVHHSGQDRKDPGTMYRVLWEQRKLSVHFALDEFAKPANGLDAGPIVWQFVDADWVTLHAGGMNNTSIGIEVCHFPEAWKDRNYYSKERNEKKNNVPHKVKNELVYHNWRDVYQFTSGQMDALARLYAGCWIAIGHQKAGGFHWRWDEPPHFPRINGTNEIPRGTIHDPKSWVGLIMHKNCSSRKWDPGGFDAVLFEEMVADYWHSFRQALP